MQLSVICLEVLQKSDKVRLLQCRHVYHVLCFDKWYSGRDFCPLCHRLVLEREVEAV